MSSQHSKLLDGDYNTSEENDEPFILVQLKNFTTISQLYVHLELGKFVFLKKWGTISMILQNLTCNPIIDRCYCKTHELKLRNDISDYNHTPF